MKAAALLTLALCACARDSLPPIATRPAPVSERQRYQEYCKAAERQTLYSETNQRIESNVP